MPLLRASLFLLLFLVAHIADHSRQGIAVPAALDFVAVSGIAVTVSCAVLAARRQRFAPDAAIAVGFGTALGFSAIHFLPDYSASLSFSYPALHVDTLSWASAIAVVLAALRLGWAGLAARRVRIAPAM